MPSTGWHPTARRSLALPEKLWRTRLSSREPGESSRMTKTLQHAQAIAVQFFWPDLIFKKHGEEQAKGYPNNRKQNFSRFPNDYVATRVEV